jgi:hypothetical protein
MTFNAAFVQATQNTQATLSKQIITISTYPLNISSSIHPANLAIPNGTDQTMTRFIQQPKVAKRTLNAAHNNTKLDPEKSVEIDSVTTGVQVPNISQLNTPLDAINTSLNRTLTQPHPVRPRN